MLNKTHEILFRLSCNMGVIIHHTYIVALIYVYFMNSL